MLNSVWLYVNNTLRRWRKIPPYVHWLVEGSYSELPAGKKNFIQRKLHKTPPNLFEVEEMLKRLACDPRIKGLVLELRELDMPLATLTRFKQLLQGFSASGKILWAWSNKFDRNTYYLALAAQKILLQPLGQVGPLGLYRGFRFWAQALAKWGIQAEFLQVSPYKTAMDYLSRSDMSPEAKEMQNWLFEDLHQHYLEAISQSRGLTQEEARLALDESPCLDEEAVELGLVDDLVFSEDLTKMLQGKLALWNNKMSGKVYQLPAQRFKKKVGILALEGVMVDGYSKDLPIKPPFSLPLLWPKKAGDQSFVSQCRCLLKRKDIAAAVVFIDTPGGAVTAASAMRSALAQVAKKMPVVVCMGPVAASGGYFVATAAHHILAQSQSLTGSIGVLTGKINTSGLWSKLAVGSDQVQRGQFSALYAEDSPLSSLEREKLSKSLLHTYQAFLRLVQEARKLSPEQLKPLVGGRVWTGQQAHRHGLVDSLGGLEQALAKAQELAGLPSATESVFFLPTRKSIAPLETAQELANELGQDFKLLEQVLLLSPII